ncbi:M48 family metalloprotease [Nocardioides pacificus]
MRTLEAGPPTGPVASLTAAAPTALDVLRQPAGTTLRFVLLVVMTTVSAAFVGNWMFLSTAEPGEVLPTWTWLAVPPLAVLLLAAVLTQLAPWWLERSHGWVPVVADDSPVALERYATLVAEAGLRREPVLMWNPTDSETRALSYGRPGAYRIAVSPALLGAARRRPAAFDAVLRHELAHIAHRDVVPAYFAIVVWFVLVAALAVPLAWRIVRPDYSLVPEYLVRVGILALVVYGQRAHLLRTREHYADVRAAITDEHREDLLRTWAAPSAPSARVRRVFPLHPSVAARTRVVREPARLGRLVWGEHAAVGVTAAWSLPLIGDLASTTGWGAQNGALLAHVAVFSLVGAYVGASLTRWAGCGGGLSHVTRASIGLAAGLALGSTLSLANTGLLRHAGADLAGSLVTAVVVGAFVFWAADLAQTLTEAVGDRWPRLTTTACVTLSAATVALVAAALMPAVELIRLHTFDVVLDHPLHAIAGSDSARALAVVAAMVGLGALLTTQVTTRAAGARVRQTWAAPMLRTAAALGTLAPLLGLVTRLRVDLDGDPDRVWRYWLALLWITVACAALAATATAASRGTARLTGAFATAGLTAVVAWAGIVAYESLLFDSTLPVSDVWRFGRDSSAVVTLVAAVPIALVWLAVRLAGRPGPRTRLAAGAMATLALAAGVLVLAPPAIVGDPTPAGTMDSALEDYVADVTPILTQRDEASAELQAAMSAPTPEAVNRIRSDIVPQYDEMLAAVRDQDVSAGPAAEVHAALLSLLLSERMLLIVQADVLDGREPVVSYADAAGAADRALYAWVSTFSEAVGP